MSGYENLIVGSEDGVCRIVLNRPEKRNALTAALLTELEQALWEADDDRAVHCVVISGAGPSFSSGYDLNQAGDFRGTDRDRPAGARRPSTTTPGSSSVASAGCGCSSRCTSRPSPRCTATASPAAPTSRCSATW